MYGEPGPSPTGLKALDELLRTPLSRREALKRAAAAGLALPTVSASIAACGSSGGSGEHSNTLVISSAAKPVTLDPMASFDGQSPLLWRCSYETLLQYKGSSTELEPRLAKSFDYTPRDRPRLVFHLRDGVTFSDGSSLDAAAVKFSLDRQLALKQGISYVFADVDRLEAPDARTLVVDYKRFVDGQPDGWGNGFGLYVISPAAIDAHSGVDKKDKWARKWLRSNMVGTGPYVLVDYREGQRATFERNKKYWGGWAAGQFEQIVIEWVTDPSAQRLALDRGEADVALFMPLDIAVSMERKPSGKAKIQEFPGWDNQLLGIPCAGGPTAKPKVRQAISYGFDYDSYVADVLYGKAKQLRGPLPDAWPEWDEKVPHYSYDPDRARTLLSEAGFTGGGFALKYIYETGYAWKRPLGELFQANMKDLGIKVEIQELSPATWIATLANKDTAGQAYGLSAGPALATSYDLMWNIYHSDAQSEAGFNFVYYTNRVCDALLDKAGHTPDDDERARVFLQVQRMVVAEAPYIYIAQPEVLQPLSKKIEGYKFNGAYANFPDLYPLHT